MQNDSFILGSTLMNVGLSAAAVFNPPAFCNGMWFKYQSGGTLFLGSGISQTPGATMYAVGSSEIVNVGGPARFFLYAAGATVTVGIGFSFNAGLSSPIAGG